MTGPVTGAPRVRAIVLAAGAGSRFGGGKLEARIDGRPLLQHVLDRLAEAGLADPIVVVAPGAEAVAGAEATAGSIDWRGARRIENPEPERGLSSSLRIGWDAAFAVEPAARAAGEPPPDAVLVALGDQPLIRPEVVRALAGAALDDARPVVAPRYAGSGARNPVRIEPAAAPLVAESSGDRGLGPLLEARPELVRWFDIDGDNPDVDTRADLANLAELAWADRVRGNREQVDRLREAPDGPDFYASVSSIFRDDPDRVGDPVLDALRGHARPSDTWLDIGAGAGRYALPLARSVREVIALDPSRSMLAALRETQVAHAIENVRTVEARWPDVLGMPRGTLAQPGGPLSDPGGPLAGTLPVDISLIAHVGYDVEAIGPFVDAMERSTRRTCLAVLMERSPAMLSAPFWPPVHGEPRVALPALPAFVDLLRARSRTPDVAMVETSRRHWTTRDDVERFVRRQTWVAPGSEKDRRMLELLDGWLVGTGDGSLELSVAEPLEIGLVAWSPR